MAGLLGFDPRLFCSGRIIASIGCPHFMHLKTTLFPNASQRSLSPVSLTKWKSVTFVISRSSGSRVLSIALLEQVSKPCTQVFQPLVVGFFVHSKNITRIQFDCDDVLNRFDSCSKFPPVWKLVARIFVYTFK